EFVNDVHLRVGAKPKFEPEPLLRIERQVVLIIAPDAAIVVLRMAKPRDDETVAQQLNRGAFGNVIRPAPIRAGMSVVRMRPIEAAGEIAVLAVAAKVSRIIQEHAAAIAKQSQIE